MKFEKSAFNQNKNAINNTFINFFNFWPFSSQFYPLTMEPSILMSEKLTQVFTLIRSKRTTEPRPFDYFYGHRSTKKIWFFIDFDHLFQIFREAACCDYLYQIKNYLYQIKFWACTTPSENYFSQKTKFWNVAWVVSNQLKLIAVFHLIKFHTILENKDYLVKFHSSVTSPQSHSLQNFRHYSSQSYSLKMTPGQKSEAIVLYDNSHVDFKTLLDFAVAV